MGEIAVKGRWKGMRNCVVVSSSNQQEFYLHKSCWGAQERVRLQQCRGRLKNRKIKRRRQKSSWEWWNPPLLCLANWVMDELSAGGKFLAAPSISLCLCVCPSSVEVILDFWCLFTSYRVTQRQTPLWLLTAVWLMIPRECWVAVSEFQSSSSHFFLFMSSHYFSDSLCAHCANTSHFRLILLWLHIGL